MAHSQLLKAIKSDIEGIPLLAKSLDRVRHDANESQRAKEAKHRQRVVVWLSPLSFRQTEAKILESRQEETGLWLLREQRFRDWALVLANHGDDF
ncbi:hypothetical protein MMC12_007993 [Toensbergia leucococca]|nr:hypothetical protein [Toensbergia leucococca]